jgi:hypothetical protein
VIWTVAHQPPHWTVRNDAHYRALRALSRLAPRLVDALEGESDRDVTAVTAEVSAALDLVRESYHAPACTQEIPRDDARRLLLVGDAVWRLDLALRAMKPMGLPKRREPRATTEARLHWHGRVEAELRELRALRRAE